MQCVCMSYGDAMTCSLHKQVCAVRGGAVVLMSELNCSLLELHLRTHGPWHPMQACTEVTKAKKDYDILELLSSLSKGRRHSPLALPLPAAARLQAWPLGSFTTAPRNCVPAAMLLHECRAPAFPIWVISAGLSITGADDHKELLDMPADHRMVESEHCASRACAGQQVEHCCAAAPVFQLGHRALLLEYIGCVVPGLRCSKAKFSLPAGVALLPTPALLALKRRQDERAARERSGAAAAMAQRTQQEQRQQEQRRRQEQEEQEQLAKQAELEGRRIPELRARAAKVGRCQGSKAASTQERLAQHNVVVAANAAVPMPALPPHPPTKLRSRCVPSAQMREYLASCTAAAAPAAATAEAQQDGGAAAAGPRSTDAASGAASPPRRLSALLRQTEVGEGELEALLAGPGGAIGEAERQAVRQGLRRARAGQAISCEPPPQLAALLDAATSRKLQQAAGSGAAAEQAACLVARLRELLEGGAHAASPSQPLASQASVAAVPGVLPALPAPHSLDAPCSIGFCPAPARLLCTAAACLLPSQLLTCDALPWRRPSSCRRPPSVRCMRWTLGWAASLRMRCPSPVRLGGRAAVGSVSSAVCGCFRGR